MSNDISTMYTKDRNMKTGRKGYCLWQNEKLDAISPAAYGDFVIQHRKRGKKLYDMYAERSDKDEETD